MKQFRVCIEALSPITFPQRKPGTQFRASLEYVPGGALFGALGEILGATGAYDPAQFRALRCHNAYAIYPGDAWVRPLPATAQGPKGRDDVCDTLIERLCWEQQQPTALIYAPTDADGRPWEARSGFYAVNDGRPIKRPSPQQRVVSRVGINRRRGTAEEGMLFSPLVLSETSLYNADDQQHDDQKRRNPQYPQYATTFSGSVVLPDGCDPAVLQNIHWLGGLQTTGHGNVMIQVSEQEHTLDTALAERITHLTAACMHQAAAYTRLGGRSFDIPGSIFTVNLLSDAILLENGWQPTMVLTGKMLYEATNGVIDAGLLRSFASYDYTGGWNVLWERPKETHVITRKGSLYVFATDQPLTPTQIQTLEQLQLLGIGERVQEGYGQVRICDEFHLCFAQHHAPDADQQIRADGAPLLAVSDSPPAATDRQPKPETPPSPPIKPSRGDKRRKKR